MEHAQNLPVDSPPPTPTMTPETPPAADVDQTPGISTPSPSKPKTAAVVFVGLLFASLIAAGSYYLGTQKQTNSPPTPTLESDTTPPPTTPMASPTSLSSNPDMTSITWLDTPVMVDNLNIFKPTPSNPSENMGYLAPQEATYYQIGTLKNNSALINGSIPVNGPRGNQLIRIVQTQQNKYTVIVDEKNDWLLEPLENDLNANIDIIQSAIPGLSLPEDIIIDENHYTKGYYSGRNYNDLNSPQQITNTPYGPLYRQNTLLTDSPAITARQLNIKLKDHTVAPINLNVGFINDDYSSNITWTDSSYEDLRFSQSFAVGCSANFMNTTPVIADDANISSSLIQIGTTSTEQPVYKITDPSHPVIDSLYELYKVGRGYGSEDLIRQSDFATQPTHFIWQDQLGDWQTFLSDQYAPLAECGKPVIYLYPQKTTPVHVRVDANIRISDPPYPEEGWQVIAHPEGTLDYQGSKYESLYWEGLGNGHYPDYHKHGEVVTQSNLISTVRKHLSQLGLNSKESQDFMDFWQDRFPPSPYIRLTWLGTADMEELAPLHITPKPNTLIRIFLEFEGLDQPKQLTPQNLSAPSRKGFTVIEWGGLLSTSR